jgi:hypothetical protein
MSDHLTLASFLASPAVACKLSKLQQLDFRRFFLDDAGLRVLLASLPTLTHVRVRTVQLQDSHSDVECSWEELRMDYANVASLAHLPLRGIRRVCVDELVSAVTAGDGGGDAARSATAAVVAASHTAAANLAAALGAAWNCTFVCDQRLILDCCVGELPLLLPLLARWQDMGTLQLRTPGGECLTPAAVGALGALLGGVPSCTKLIITGPTPHPSALLLPALASTSVSKVFLDDGRMTDVQLMLWCAGGQPSHPVTVQLRLGCDFDGDMSHVRTILSVAGSGVCLLHHWEWLAESESTDGYDNDGTISDDVGED